jgi:hypothetical protein
MASDLSSWRSLYDVLGDVLAAATADGPSRRESNRKQSVEPRANRLDNEFGSSRAPTE